MKAIAIIVVCVCLSPFIVYVLFKFATFGFFKGRELAKRFPQKGDGANGK